MNDERHDDEAADLDAGETDAAEETDASEEPKPAAGDEPTVPVPATAAGRARAGVEEDDDAEQSSGLTDDFEQVEAELSAELGGLGVEDEDEDEDDEEAGEPEPDDQVAVPAAERSGETVEVDTVAVSDREAAEEAAHAGLKARTAASVAKRGITTGSGEAVAVAPVPAAVGAAGEPPKPRLWLRFLTGAFVIVAAMATATSVSAIAILDGFANDLAHNDALASSRPKLADIKGGDPQTIMILGSDKRTSTDEVWGLSDTTMLLRVDPDTERMALLSLPRDLKVEIPRLGTDKLNSAYSYGGPELTLDTVKKLLGIEINVLVNVDFEGFYDAVNAIDCVYVDVDRHYYVPPESGYDDIDIEAGYTKLCGYRALDFVRYRHNDTDIVRNARQQDFIREARQRIPPGVLFDRRKELLDIFTKYTTSSIESGTEILGLLKTFLEARHAEVEQIHLDTAFADSYVVASTDQLKAAVAQFLGTGQEAAKPDEGAASKSSKPDKQKNKPDDNAPPESPSEPAMIDSTTSGQQYAQLLDKYLRDRKAHLAVYYPTQLVANAITAITDESRAFQLPGPDDKEIYRGYKFVVAYADAGYAGAFNSYYGVSGVNWHDPPILEHPSETREINGQDYLLFYDAGRLRLVGWKTGDGAYWVINTLTQALSEDEMLAIATTTRKLD